MKRWGIVLAVLLLTAGCALADDSGFGLDNERAQAIYWEYSGAVIEIMPRSRRRGGRLPSSCLSRSKGG